MASAKGASGARRSAIAERARLQAEWAQLKCSNSPDILRGVVALVDVGNGSNAVALRAALAALGATVAPEWSTLVTHVIWTAEGSRQIRAAARSLAARLVSPLWVEACASAARRLPERAFPTGTRPSDLPSPRALRHMLREAEKENLTLISLSDTTKINTQERAKDNPLPKQRLRISSEHDTSTDQSTDLSSDQSRDRSNLPSRVNTAPRRALPMSITPDNGPPKKSKRKLFTYKEDEVGGSTSGSEGEAGKITVRKPSLIQNKAKPIKIKMAPNKAITQAKSGVKGLSHQNLRDLARAERMAQRLAATPRKTQRPVRRNIIVLTGMSRSERIAVATAVRQLKGKLRREVGKHTTHVILGSGRKDTSTPDDITGIQPFADITCTNRNTCALATCDNRSYPALTAAISDQQTFKPRTLHSLEGAARGCFVVSCAWALNSAKEGKWLREDCYEIPHLKKLSNDARIERSILGRNRKEFAIDVFNKMAIHLTDSAEQREAAISLIMLCGGVLSENGVKIGTEPGMVRSKWIFDSVEATRPRGKKRYIVRNVISGAVQERDTQIDEVFNTIESNLFNLGL